MAPSLPRVPVRHTGTVMIGAYPQAPPPETEEVLSTPEWLQVENRRRRLQVENRRLRLRVENRRLRNQLSAASAASAHGLLAEASSRTVTTNDEPARATVAAANTLLATLKVENERLRTQNERVQAGVQLSNAQRQQQGRDLQVENERLRTQHERVQTGVQLSNATSPDARALSILRSLSILLRPLSPLASALAVALVASSDLVVTPLTDLGVLPGHSANNFALTPAEVDRAVLGLYHAGAANGNASSVFYSVLIAYLWLGIIRRL